MYSPEEMNSIVANKVFQEIIETEKTYNETLTLLDNGLCKNEITHGNELLEQLHLLIGSLKTISDSLLKNIEDAVKQGITNGEVLRKQRQQLLTAFFNGYKNYAATFEKFCIAQKNQPMEFREIQTYISLYNHKRLSLEAYFIEPIQRGPRYLLLVKETEKRSEHLDPTNLHELQQLKLLIQENLGLINSSLDKPTSKPYQFGDYTWALLGWDKPTPTQENTTASSSYGYQFGDLTRYAVSTLFQTKPTEPPKFTNDAASFDFEMLDPSDDDSDFDDGLNL